ncbi:ectin-like [Clytia hemisphaerica]|uniref:SCP domain-containing protein n=1 Tax=Clytia hemisphaerica TaxID=252671 RepID=A0A7M5TZI7_9CNID|eukprot:TCONS_00026290-protein
MDSSNLLNLRTYILILTFILLLLKQINSLKDFTEKNAIDLINKHRITHLGNGASSLQKDFTLTQKAKKLVEKAMKNKGFDKDGYAGVNTYQVCATFGAHVTSRQVVDTWYNEVCDVDFETNDFKPGTESFAQLVWKDTQRVGLAKATGRNKNQTCQYIAGLFRPPGNIDGFYDENVLKGKFDEKYCDEL